MRTALGMGVLTFYIVLFVAGSQDIVAQHLHAEITEVNRWFRVLLFVLPVLVAVIAWKWWP
jgi:ubiquinol-cytochrome c reductase cytochrome b subunit